VRTAKSPHLILPFCALMHALSACGGDAVTSYERRRRRKAHRVGPAGGGGVLVAHGKIALPHFAVLRLDARLARAAASRLDVAEAELARAPAALKLAEESRAAKVVARALFAGVI